MLSDIMNDSALSKSISLCYLIMSRPTLFPYSNNESVIQQSVNVRWAVSECGAEVYAIYSGTFAGVT